MKIPAITNCMNKNNNTNFSGVWGEKTFIKAKERANTVCDNYELKYYPFLEETKENVDSIILQKSKELEESQKNSLAELKNDPEKTIYYEKTKVKSAKKLKLTSLECEIIAEKLDKDLPKTLNEYNKLVNIAKKVLKIKV